MIKERCQQSYGLPSSLLGFSHALKNSPPDCFLPRLHRGRAFESHYRHVARKKEALRMECFFFLGWIMGFEPTTFRATI